MEQAIGEGRRPLFISHFALKVIAVILMTIDHIGLFLLPVDSTAYLILRIIGRLAFPLFAFMAIQGVFRSHAPFRYALRLLVIGAVMDLALLLIERAYPGNAMTELGLGVLAFALLNKKSRLSFLAVLPAAVMVLSDFSFFPLKAEYGGLGLMMMASFYLSERIVAFLYASSGPGSGLSGEARFSANLLSAFFLLVINVIIFIVSCYDSSSPLIANGLAPSVEEWSFLAGLAILCYSGKQGYRNKALNYGFYAYYPLHIVILYLIGLLAYAS